MGGGLLITRRRAKSPIEPDAVRLASKALLQETCVVGGSAVVAVYATSKITGVRSVSKIRVNGFNSHSSKNICHHCHLSMAHTLQKFY